MVFAFINVYNVLESDNLYPGCAGLQIYSVFPKCGS